MSKKYKVLIAVVVIVIAASFFFLARKPAQEKPGGLVVASDDGDIRLVIPNGALPAGVDSGRIKVIKLDGDYGEGVLAAYSLEPEGLEFSSPVDVVMEFPSEENQALPLLVHIGKDGDEIINNTSVVLDDAADKLTLSGKISHFSELIVVSYEDFEITSSGGGAYNEGDQVPFKFTIKNKGKGIKYTDEDFRQYTQNFKPDSTYDVGEVKLVTDFDDDILTPDTRIVPAQSGLAQAQTYEYETTFICTKEGSDFVHTGPVSLQYTMTGYRAFSSDMKDERVQIWLDTREDYECKKKEGGGMTRICPPVTVMCGGGVSFSGYYECDPVTGEQVGNVLLDINTHEPVTEKCP